MSLALEMCGVAKRYVAGFGGCLASVTVLRSIDLVVRPGETVAVLGPSGAGKSTLLLAAAGLLAPDRGDIRWCGDASPSAAMQCAMYHFAAARAEAPRIPPETRIHLVDDPDALAGSGATHLARWIMQRCHVGASVVIGTRCRATAYALAPRVLALVGGELRGDSVSSTPRVAEATRSLVRRHASAPNAGD
jgi:energy-coupling factor transporter ATP-binding protein EcfA2